MKLSIFTDELKVDITEGLPIIKSWGLNYVDLRGWIYGSHFEGLNVEQLYDLRKLLDTYDMTVACLQSSLAKVHLPNKERQQIEAAKLEAIIRAADVLDCRMVRSFHYWQPPAEGKGSLAVQPDQQQAVLDIFAPLAQRAREAGLQLLFENCGVEPDEVFTILDALDVPDWGMAWDPHNSWMHEERLRDEDAFIDRMLSRTGCLHVKAKRAVQGLSPDNELIPYDKILRMAQAASIPGPVSIETHNPDQSVDNIEMSQRTTEVILSAWPGGRHVAQGIKRDWEENPVGFVVVGLGMGKNRSRMIMNTPGAKLVGLCDLDEERAKEFSAEIDIPYKTDLAEWLVDDEVEVVFVVTETGHHAKIGIQALEAGKHVIVTKPMEASLVACDELIQKADEKGLLLAVDFQYRFEPTNMTLKRMVAKGLFGRLLSGNSSLKIQRTMEYFNRNNGWRGTRRLDGGGVLSNQSIHLIDQIAFTVGSPKRVRADIYTANHDIEAEDLGTAVWEYEDGLVITFTATTNYAHHTWYTHFELDGTKGAYTASDRGPYDKPFVRWFYNERWNNAAPELVTSPWLNSVDNMAAAVRTGAELIADGREGRRTQAILDGMYRSAYETDGGWVEVDVELVSLVA